eukprot:143442-Amphidinium_carterae.1
MHVDTTIARTSMAWMVSALAPGPFQLVIALPKTYMRHIASKIMPACTWRKERCAQCSEPSWQLNKFTARVAACTKHTVIQSTDPT